MHDARVDDGSLAESSEHGDDGGCGQGVSAEGGIDLSGQGGDYFISLCRIRSALPPLNSNALVFTRSDSLVAWKAAVRERPLTDRVVTMVSSRVRLVASKATLRVGEITDRSGARPGVVVPARWS